MAIPNSTPKGYTTPYPDHSQVVNHKPKLIPRSELYPTQDPSNYLAEAKSYLSFGTTPLYFYNSN